MKFSPRQLCHLTLFLQMKATSVYIVSVHDSDRKWESCTLATERKKEMQKVWDVYKTYMLHIHKGTDHHIKKGGKEKKKRKKGRNWYFWLIMTWQWQFISLLFQSWPLRSVPDQRPVPQSWSPQSVKTVKPQRALTSWREIPPYLPRSPSQRLRKTGHLTRSHKGDAYDKTCQRDQGVLSLFKAPFVCTQH